MRHPTPDGGTVHITEDSVHITDSQREEVVYWDRSEFSEDSYSALAAANAVALAISRGTGKVRDVLDHAREGTSHDIIFPDEQARDPSARTL